MKMFPTNIYVGMCGRCAQICGSRSCAGIHTFDVWLLVSTGKVLALHCTVFPGIPVSQHCVSSEFLSGISRHLTLKTDDLINLCIVCLIVVTRSGQKTTTKRKHTKKKLASFQKGKISCVIFGRKRFCTTLCCFSDHVAVSTANLFHHLCKTRERIYQCCELGGLSRAIAGINAVYIVRLSLHQYCMNSF